MVLQDRSFDTISRVHPLEAVVQRHPGAGDRGRAGAAIGLDDVAVDGDLAFAERFEIDHGAHGAADQALDFQRAAGLLAGGGLAAHAVAGGARQHAVFGGHPAAAWPRSHGGTRSSRLAVHRTWVSPNLTRQEPSACFETPRSSVTARARLDGRMWIPFLTVPAARCCVHRVFAALLMQTEARENASLPLCVAPTRRDAPLGARHSRKMQDRTSLSREDALYSGKGRMACLPLRSGKRGKRT
jgi:hypothetical protein